MAAGEDQAAALAEPGRGREEAFGAGVGECAEGRGGRGDLALGLQAVGQTELRDVGEGMLAVALEEGVVDRLGQIVLALGKVDAGEAEPRQRRDGGGLAGGDELLERLGRAGLIEGGHGPFGGFLAPAGELLEADDQGQDGDQHDRDLVAVRVPPVLERLEFVDGFGRGVGEVPVFFCHGLRCPVSAARLAGGGVCVARWWALRDLNPRPRDYESPALTAELRALNQRDLRTILQKAPRNQAETENDPCCAVEPI